MVNPSGAARSYSELLREVLLVVSDTEKARKARVVLTL